MSNQNKAKEKFLAERLPIRVIADQEDELNSGLFYAIRMNQIDVAKKLIDNGAGIERDRDGRTALHFAAGEFSSEIARYLVDKGADVNSLDSSGTTPLFMAIHAADLEMVMYLMTNGAEVNLFTKSNKSPLDTAFEIYIGQETLEDKPKTQREIKQHFRYKEIITYLLQNGSNVSCFNPKYLKYLDLSDKDDADLFSLMLTKCVSLNGSYIKSYLISIIYRLIDELYRNNPNFGVLELGSHDLSEQQITDLCFALRQNQVVTELDLSNTRLTLGGIRALAKLFEVNKSIVRLNLNNNDISWEGIQILTRAIAKNGSLLYLSIGRSINSSAAQDEEESKKKSLIGGKEGLIELKNCLKNNYSLLELEICDEQIETQYKVSFQNFLKRNQLLFPLYQSVRKGDVASVGEFLTISGRQVKDKALYYALKLACLENNMELVKYLVEQKSPLEMPKDINPPLLLTAKEGNFELTRYLLFKGAGNIKNNPDMLAQVVDNKIINLLQTFNKPPSENITVSKNQYVLLREWSPTINGKEAGYLAALKYGNVGHMSMVIHDDDKEIYVSFWPSLPPTKIDERVGNINHTLLQDSESEPRKPDNYIMLHSLDVKKMIEEYNRKSKSLYCLVGNKKNSTDKDAYNCSGMVYELLEVGGLFDHLLNQNRRLNNKTTLIKPSDVADLAHQASLVEHKLFPETEFYLKEIFEAEILKEAEKGSFYFYYLTTKVKPDYLELYKRVEPNYLSFLQKVSKICKDADEKNKNAFKEELISIAKKGSKGWLEFMKSNPIIRKKYNFYYKNEKEFIDTLAQIKIQSDQELIQQKRVELLTITGSLKDINKHKDPQWQKNAKIQNYLLYELFDKILDDPLTDISLRDEMGLNALHRAVIKGDSYCVERLLKKFPFAINSEIVRSREGDRNYYKSRLGIFTPYSTEMLGWTPLDIAIARKDEDLIHLIHKHYGHSNNRIDYSTNLMVQASA